MSKKIGLLSHCIVKYQKLATESAHFFLSNAGLNSTVAAFQRENALLPYTLLHYIYPILYYLLSSFKHWSQQTQKCLNLISVLKTNSCGDIDINIFSNVERLSDAVPQPICYYLQCFVYRIPEFLAEKQLVDLRDFFFFFQRAPFKLFFLYNEIFLTGFLGLI